MAAYAFMLVFAIPGPILFLVLNTEAMLIFQVAKEGHDALGMAVCAALGHTVTYQVLYAVGEKSLHRVAFLSRRLTAMTPEERHRIVHGTSYALAVGSVFGVPPVVLAAPLASTVGYPRWKLAGITFSCRVLRFFVLASAGDSLWTWLGL